MVKQKKKNKVRIWGCLSLELKGHLIRVDKIAIGSNFAFILLGEDLNIP